MAACRGANYKLALTGDRLFLDRGTFLDRPSLSLTVKSLRSLELMRKSIIPPLVLMLVSLSTYGVLRFGLGGMLGLDISATAKLGLEEAAMVVAVVAALLIVVRLAWADLRIRSGELERPLVVRLVFVRQGKEFVRAVHAATVEAKPPQREGGSLG